jgi:hypothetical protein
VKKTQRALRVMKWKATVNSREAREFRLFLTEIKLFDKKSPLISIKNKDFDKELPRPGIRQKSKFLIFAGVLYRGG